jgi:flagellar motility protein MotE (MotC chaperone)
MTPTLGSAPAGVCAPDAAELAKSAGLSPAELQMLQNLQNRRGQIDQREKDLDTQVQLMTAAEVKLDAKLKAMNDLKAQIEVLMGQADQKTQGEVDRLVTVYTKMKPDAAAAVMSQLEDKVRVPVAAGMKPAVLAAILNKMNPADAKKLTELLAHRFAPVQQLADAARTSPPAQPAAATAKPDGKADAPSAADAKSPDDANVDDDAAKPAKKAKPAKLAKRAPKRKPRRAKAATQQATAASKPAVSLAKDPAKPATPSPTAAPAKAS